MNPAFADSYFWFALVNARDRHHTDAKSFLSTFDGRIVTTEWVLVEVGDGLASTPEARREFTSLYADIHSDPGIEVVGFELPFWETGLRLFGDRPDKQWSLTDCLSFTIMNRRGIVEALTGDHHFEQAGFAILFK